MENFYTKIKKGIKLPNPNEELHGIKMPFRMAICGSSGSGKTNTLINLIKLCPNTFNKIVVIIPTSDEPLYEYLQEQSKGLIHFYTKVKNKRGSEPSELNKSSRGATTKSTVKSKQGSWIPTMDVLLKEQVKGKHQHTLVVFDDIVNEPKKIQEEIVYEYFLRGRKSNLSCVYISQMYYGIIKSIRGQIQYIILKNISSDKDLKCILKEYPLECNLEELKHIYHSIMNEDLMNNLMIDMNDASKRLRKNITQVIQLKSEYE